MFCSSRSNLLAWEKKATIKSVEDVRTFMMDALRRPDEVYRDIFHDNIRYFLRRVGGDYWLCVITVGSEARTAYLINQK
jgi:hypothetical protein